MPSTFALTLALLARAGAVATSTSLGGVVAPNPFPAARGCRVEPGGAGSTFRKITYPNSLSVFVSDGSSDIRDMVGVRPLLAPTEISDILDCVRQPNFPWTTARHTKFPTTDIETASIGWIDALLQPHLSNQLFPTIAELFQVSTSQLYLRDSFIIKYEAPSAISVRTSETRDESPGIEVQASLGAHWDESCFSFVVQLNDLNEFSGGGTKFAHSSEAISVAPGEVLCFCGYNLHEGVPITEGVRYLLTGFVDLRAPPSVLSRFTDGQPIVEGEERLRKIHCLTDFASPHLPFNVNMLRSQYECDGEELLRAIAYGPSPLRYVDMRPLAKKCDAWLRRGDCEDERFFRFLQQVIGDNE